MLTKETYLTSQNNNSIDLTIPTKPITRLSIVIYKQKPSNTTLTSFQSIITLQLQLK